jgi:hypothetical protein
MNSIIITIEIEPDFLTKIINGGFYLAVAFFAGFVVVVATGVLFSLCKKKDGTK